MLTVTHSGTLVFRQRRQLRILGAQELAFADSCTLFVGRGDPDPGLWLAAQHLVLEKDYFLGVCVADPVVPTFSEPKLTAWAQECVTVDNRHTKMHSYKRHMQIVR